MLDLCIYVSCGVLVCGCVCGFGIRHVRVCVLFGVLCGVAWFDYVCAVCVCCFCLVYNCDRVICL